MRRSRLLALLVTGLVLVLVICVLHVNPNGYTTVANGNEGQSVGADPVLPRKSGPSNVATGRNLESLETPEPTVIASQPKLCDMIGCHDRAVTQRYGQRGDFWVLYNYIPASNWFGCADTITYTTHGDHTFLDNLETLLLRWQGPISISIFAPGTDFDVSLQSIQYVRNCGPHAQLIQDLVTFHVYFPNKHVPKNIPKVNGTYHLNGIKIDCKLSPPWTRMTVQSYKTTHKILYPVNVGRNVAREEAVTHFVLASDIELYPNPKLIPSFLAMIKNHVEIPAKNQDNTRIRKVYPLSIFELKEKKQLPENKTQLVTMLKKGDAVPFHKYVCANCHKVPQAEEWIALPESPSLHVFHVGKRTGKFLHWEPIYVGTHAEPLYDERLSWEGKSDKMTQGYAMCVLDYEFHILDNAFLVHRPGIKTNHKDKEREVHVKRTALLIRQQILPEMKLLYGQLKGCTV